MKNPKSLFTLILLLIVSSGFSYLVTKKSGNEIKWRPLPATLSYKMNQNEPNSACSTRIKNGFQAWENEARSNVDYNYTGETSISSASNDVTNVVCFPNQNSSYPNWLAGCFWWYNTSTYGLTEFDIEVYQKWNWHYGDSPGSDTYDFQSTMTHEVGHTLGLNDLYLYYDREKTMYGYGTKASTKQRTLEQDDKDGIAYLYPTNAVDRVWIKTATDDDGRVPYPGSVFWQSPDISLKPDPPVIAQSCTVYVTARNMRPDSQYARIIIEVHDPDVTLDPRKSVLYADTLTNCKIQPGNRDTIGYNNWYYESWAHRYCGEGESTYSFIWTPDSNTFGEAHYCMVATVECSPDTQVAGDDNDDAVHNFHTTKEASGGSGQIMSTDAGNPTGVPVWRHLYFDLINLPAGWSASIPPFLDSMLLTPTDTFWPVPIGIIPAPSAQRGDYGIVQLRCVLKSETNPNLVLLTGGVIWKVIVGEPGDVGTAQILTPSGTIGEGTVITPRAIVKNYGTTTETFGVKFKIGEIYSDDTSNITLAPGTTMEIAFNLWTAVMGNYTASCSTQLDKDWKNYNDKLSFSFAVGSRQLPGWQTLASIPTAPSGKYPKAGTCMAGLSSTGKIYLLKASKTADFYVFTSPPTAYDLGEFTGGDPDVMPLGSREGGDGKNPNKGASIAAYEAGNSLFVLRGNNTPGFWKFSARADSGESLGSWSKVANIPPGTKNPKDGSGSVAVTKGGNDYIFAMKGSKTDEFYLYDIGANTWSAPLPAPPTGTSGKFGYKKGSCLAYDGDNTVYVLKGNYGDLFMLKLDSLKWTELTRYDKKVYIDPDGKKKAPKDGAALVYHNNYLYLLKGNNTNVLWSYGSLENVTSSSWSSVPFPLIEDIPIFDSGKKVKGGGGMIKFGQYFYVTKGNKTPEFFRHVLPVESVFGYPMISTSEGILSNNVTSSEFKLMIAPNPAINVMTISYNLPKAERASLKLYSVYGSMVKSYYNSIPTKNGVIIIKAKDLSAGVYLLRFNAGDIKVMRKIVLEK